MNGTKRYLRAGSCNPIRCKNNEVRIKHRNVSNLPGRCVQQYKGVVKICYHSFVKAVDTENQRNRVEKAVQDRNKLLEEHRNYHLEVHTTEMRPW